MLIKPILLLNLFICCFQLSIAQPSVNMIDVVSERLIGSIRSKQTEQLFVVTDKSFYRSGEGIWFRVFLLRSASQKMSHVTKNVFIDFINSSDSVVSTLLIDADRAQSGARLNIASSVATGFYWIRAYTCYMTQEEKNKIAVQPVYVINPATPNESSRGNRRTTESKPGISMQFFPEGGSLITGSDCSVAFRIINGNGQPVAVTGFIRDSRDSVVTSFTSDKYGLGKFVVFPTRGRSYKAHIPVDGKDQVFPLPGYNFHAGQLSMVKQGNGDMKITVLLEDSVYRKDLRTYVVGVAKDSLCFASIGTGMYEVSVPAKSLPDGPTTFYLLDDQLKVLSERRVYTRNNLVIKAELDKNVYRKRDKADLKIAVTDGRDHPLIASLSIAIVDSNLLLPESTDKVVADYFENREQLFPGDWYLSGANELTDQQMDILMMTGANSYNDILFKKNDPAFYTADDDSLLYVKGTAIFTNKKPVSNKNIALFSPSGTSTYGVDTTNNEGRFVFPLAEYPDSTRFAIQVMNDRGRPEETSITLDTLRFPRINSEPVKERFAIRQANINYYSRLYGDSTNPDFVSELSPVTVKGYKKEAKYDESKRMSQDSKIITHDDFGRGGSTRVANAVLRVPGLQVIGGYITIKGLSAFGSGPGTEPIVLLDGVQIPVAGGDGMGTVSPVLNYLNSLNADDISFIEVMTGPEASAFGVRGRSGAILINTGATDETKSNSLLRIFRVRGYHVPPPFLMPDYNNPKTKAAKFNDLRSTLYWQAGGVTDTTGKLNVSFFTSDVATNYKIVITGVTGNGDIIRRTLSFRTQ